MKPDNVFVDWSHDEQGHVRPERVALGDLDCALRLEDGGYIRILNGGRLGNVMWSSPEQLTGQGIGKPSDVFAFGLMVSSIRSCYTTDFELSLTLSVYL